jgi:hypothetical protein
MLAEQRLFASPSTELAAVPAHARAHKISGIISAPRPEFRVNSRWRSAATA